MGLPPASSFLFLNEVQTTVGVKANMWTVNLTLFTLSNKLLSVNTTGFGNHAQADFDDGFLRRKQRRNRTTFTLQQVILPNTNGGGKTNKQINKMQKKQTRIKSGKTSVFFKVR